MQFLPWRITFPVMTGLKIWKLSWQRWYLNGNSGWGAREKQSADKIEICCKEKISVMPGYARVGRVVINAMKQWRNIQKKSFGRATRNLDELSDSSIRKGLHFGRCDHYQCHHQALGGAGYIRANLVCNRKGWGKSPQKRRNNKVFMPYLTVGQRLKKRKENFER